MKRRTTWLFAAVALGLSALVVHLAAGAGAPMAASGARLVLEPRPSGGGGVRAAGQGTGAGFKLKLESGTNGVIYVIQSGNDLHNWQTLLAVKTTGGTMALGEIPATNTMQYFRLIQADGDTNAPVWTNGVQGKLASGPPGHIVARWSPAKDETGVAEYRIFINGTLYTNVLGSVLSTEFNLNPHLRTEISIQALDPSDNATGVLIMSVIPGDNLLAVSDDGGRVYVFQYQPGNTNLFSASLRIADFSGNDRGLVMGDFDRDGFLDIVAGHPASSRMNAIFFKGQGDGTFAAGVALPAPLNDSGYVMEAAAGDFDSDGNLDVIFNCNNTRTYFYWGNGDGTFTVETRDIGGTGRGMSAGDFNEDGRLDFARATTSDGRVRVHLSNGDRTFTTLTNFVDVGNDPYGLAVGDFDEDGHLDAIAGGSGDGNMSFLKGLGNGTFTNLGGTNLANIDINTYNAVDAFDYSGDGHLDLVMSGANGQAYYWAGLGDGTFSTNRVTVATGLSAAFGVAAPLPPPLMDINLTPQNPVIALNGSITFTASGSGVRSNDVFRWSFGDSGTNLYEWEFTTNSPNLGPSAAHTYLKEGRFVTRLWHTSSNGVQSTRGTWATVKGNAPLANPGGPYVLGEIAATQAVWTATLNATNSTDDFGITSYIWNFGDGSQWATNSGPGVAHAWNNRVSNTNGAPWAVTLIVVDAAGQTGTNSTTVTFTNGAPPVAVIIGPSLIDETVATNGSWFAAFSGTNSTDDLGIWKYDWNFGNGRTATGPNVNTTYPSVGTNTVRLTVTDNAGQTNSTTHTIVIKANGLPVPVISGNRFLTEAVATNGQWFGSFSGTNSTDDKGIYVYQWRFGDGGTASGASVTHNYAGTGVYPLVLTVTDFGDQSVSVTQNVIVVAGELPVARLTADPRSPEGAQPINFSSAASSDDYGILFRRLLLPSPQRFDFAGDAVDANQWRAANTVQNGKLIVTGQTSWDNSYFFSGRLLMRRGGAIEGRVDTPTGSPTRAMVGLRSLDQSSGSYTRLEYGIYFNDGEIRVYELGNDRGRKTNYNKGTAYDFRIETKPDAGARYYLRPSGAGESFVLFYESTSYSDAVLGFGATVYDPTPFGFDDFVIERGMLPFGDGLSSVFPSGPVTLEVTDHALQTNATTITLTTIIGAPPVAIINGPTNGLAGVELAFDGYFSSDDHAIASYVWDFGDGTPKRLGPAVSHRYSTVGTYTTRLTVYDYAGQSNSATLVTTVSGGNLLACVPWRIVGGIEQPHEVYAGKLVTLKAVARNIPVPFTYIWDPGNGSALVTNQITNVVASGIYNLEATNSYTGAEGTPYYATARVILTNGTVLGDVYPVVIRPKTLDTEMKVAIDEGLWYLHKVQNRYALDTNNTAGDWVDSRNGGYKISATASVLHAFGINGHAITDDATQDPYVDTVQRGMNYLLTALTSTAIGPQTYGDPDGNRNGIGLGANSGRPIYETGPVMDAFVAAARPELVAQVGGANVLGRTFKDLMQDMVDQYCWGQSDFTDSRGGGWRYSWNEHPDNSASQWGSIGMLAARDYWGIAIPDWVIKRNEVWVAYSMRNVGFGYTGQDTAGRGPGGVEATTPSALVQMAFAGISTTNSLWLFGENYLANNWAGILAINNVYAHYAIAKAMRTAVPQPVHNLAANGKDWFLDPVDGLARFTIDKQRGDGSWTDNQWVDVQLATSWSTIILSSSLFQRGPVAVITMKPNPAAVGFPIVFDASGSYHQHPAYRVVEYRWDFNPADGLDFEHPDAVGPIATNSYSAISTNTIALQVRDNATPFLSDVATLVVRVTIPPFPPTPDSGGPYYVAVGEDIHLDASGSFDVDSAQGDFIRSYDWEVDFAQPLDFADGVQGAKATLVGGFPSAGPRQIGLRVTDATSLVFPQLGKPDLTADDFTVVYVYDRAIGDLKARPKHNKIQLTWTKAGDYVAVLRSTVGPDRGFREIGRTFSTYATFLDENVEYNVEYYYRLIVYANNRAEPIGISDPEFIVSRQRGLEDHPPVFLSTPIRLTRVGDLYNPTLDAVDPENDPITFNVLQGPTNLTVNVTNGQVNFTPTAAQIGLHTLTFEATNAAGRDVLNFSLFVQPASNAPPSVSIGGPYAALTGQPIQFTSTVSDPDGNPLYLAWGFGDGTTDTNANPVHTFNAAGDYLVTLFVNDGYGGTVSARTHAVISVPNRPPNAVVAQGPAFNSRVGEQLLLDGSGSFDLDGDPLTFTWIWGDGTTNGPSPAAGLLTAAHTYTGMGNYSGQLLVADNRGGQGVANFTVAVAASNQPPLVVLNVSSNSPYANTVVTFDANGTGDPEGDPLTFEWDFGDRFKTTGRIVTHVYPSVGDFPLTLTVRDNHGGLTVVTQLVHALNSPPQFTSQPPLLVKAGKAYAYTPTVTDLNGDPITFQLVTNPPAMTINTNPVPGMTYGALDWLPGTNDVGPHPIALRATDAQGASSDQTFTLVVTTPTGPEMDLEPAGIVMTNLFVDSQTLAMTGTVRVVFRNNGDDAVPVPYTVSVFVDADGDGAYSTNPVPGMPADQRVAFAPVQAGAQKGFLYTLEISVQGQALFKDAPLSAFVDSENVLPEFNENNNIRRAGFDVNTNQPPVLDVSASRMAVNRSDLPASAGLSARLGNSGYVNVPTNVAVAFYDGNPTSGGVLIGVARSTRVLVPGQFEDVSITWSSPAISNHTVFVVADDNGAGVGQLAEISETNNRFSAEADLAANLPPLADAGPDQTINLGDTALLNGRGSSDPEGKPLTYRWSYLTIPVGSHPQLTGAQSAQPALQADAAGDYTFSLSANDGLQDSTNTDTVVITVVDPNANHYPVISSRPAFTGMSNVLYTYAVIATDEDGDKLTYSLGQRPPGMTITTNGLISWTPTNTGTFFIQVNVFDSKGAGLFQNWSLTITPFQNLPPQFTSTPVQTGSPGSNYLYDVEANDVNHDAITFRLVQNPAGMNINGSSGLITWTPGAAQLGGFPVRVSATDSRGAASTQAFNVVVFTPGADGPIVQPIPDQIVVGPAAFTPLSLDPYVFDPNNTDSQLTWTVTGASNLSVTINSNRVATITYSNGVLTSERLTFLATDPTGKSGFAAAQFTVRAADKPPVATLANLSETETTSIQTGFFELKGTADDPDAIDPVAYRVLLYDGNGVRVGDVTPKPVNADGWHEGRVPVGGSLGQLDFTLVRNGGYTLALEVRGGDFIATATATIAVETGLKIGQLRFSQKDLILPVRGAALGVVRTYDSLNTTSSDFGYSWTYTVYDLDLTINETRVQEQDLFGERFSLRTGGGRDVTLDMPDTGNRVTFKYSLNQGGLFRLRAAWTPPPGVNATLEPTVSPNQIALWQLRYWEAAPLETGLEGFDFPGFILTLQDGTKYRIDREKLGEHFIASDSAIGSYVEAYGDAHISRISETSGDHTEFVRSGATLKSIEKYDNLNNKLKSVVFQRDANNRIIGIYTPENVDSNNVPVGPASMKYDYDLTGNLVKASKLTDPSNLVYATTTYGYSNPRFPHYITEIKDPKGQSAMRTEYDADGRIVATVDAQGNRTEIKHDIAARTDTVYDKLGNPTLLAYDEKGNVVVEVNALGGVTRRSYDAYGNAAVIVDPLGNTNTFVRDASGNILSHTDPLGNVTTNSYMGDGSLITTTDPLGRVIRNDFDTNGNITVTTDAAGMVTRFGYDDASHQTSITDAAGNTTQFEYDTTGNLKRRIDAAGNTTAYTYDSNSRQTSVTTIVAVAPGVFQTNTTSATYNSDGKPTSQTDALGNTTRTEYDVSGKPTAIVDSLGRRVETRYDISGRPVQVSYPDGTSTRTTYDVAGRRTSATDRAGRTTYFEYDVLGRQITIIYPDDSPGDLSDNPRTHTEYDLGDRVAALIDELGNRTTFAYDAAGRRIGVTNALGMVMTFTYDAAGRKTSQSDPLGRTTFYLYDNVGRLLRTVLPDGSEQRSEYNALGQKVAEVDPSGARTRSEYDTRGQVVAVIDGLGQTNTFGYDEQGRQVLRKDPLNRTTRWEYDGFGHQTRRTLPLGMSESFAYDAYGRMSSHTDFNGSTIQLTYDPSSGNVATKKYPDNSQITFAYSTADKLIKATDVRGDTSYEYDARDRVTRVTQPGAGRTISYTYDARGNRTSITTPAGTTRFTYDALNRLSTVTQPDGGVATYQYDAIGNRSGLIYPNGVRTEYTYNSLNRLVTLVNKRADGSVLSGYTYTTGPAGNRTRVVEQSGRTVTYVYDAIYRLTSETIVTPGTGTNTIVYTYDAVGNRLSKSDVGGTTNYVYDANDRLVSAGAATNTYDLNGNLVTMTLDAATTTYAYNYENRMISATMPSGQLRYIYDAAGARVRSEVGGVATDYLVDQNRLVPQVLEERSAAGALLASYTYGDDLISQSRGGQQSYYLLDGQNSTRQLTDASQAVTDTYAYDAFGVQLQHAGTTENSYLYNGQFYDANVGFYYLRARMYDPASGRFTSMDPFDGSIFDPPTLHKYVYVGNNPVTKHDPLGLFEGLIGLSIAIAIIGVLASIGFGVYWGIKVFDYFPPNAFQSLPDAFMVGGSIAVNPSNQLARTGNALAFGLAVALALDSGLGGVEALFPFRAGSLQAWIYPYAGAQVAIDQNLIRRPGAGVSGSFYAGFVWNAKQPSDYTGEFFSVSGAFLPKRLKSKIAPNVTLFSGPPSGGATEGSYGMSFTLYNRSSAPSSVPTARWGVSATHTFYFDPKVVDTAGLSLPSFPTPNLNYLDAVAVDSAFLDLF